MRYADTLKNIFEFILNVRKQAGFDLKPNAGSPGRDIMLDKTIRMDWFAQISEKAVGPGDLVTYLDPAGRKTMGLIESYDAGQKTGKMYATDASRGEVSSIEFADAYLDSANFLRPKMDLFMGNLAGLFAGMDEDHDDEQNMDPSYPSPEPH